MVFRSGEPTPTIVSSGGFLAIGDDLSAVRTTALRFTTQRDTPQLDPSKEMLANAPRCTGDRWPGFADADYAGGVDRAWKVKLTTAQTSHRTVPAAEPAHSGARL